MSVIDNWNMRCPRCREDGKIDIVAKVSVRLTSDGTDAGEARDGAHEWDDNSQADCCNCGFSGQVKDYRLKGLDLAERAEDTPWRLDPQIRILADEPSDRQHLRIVDRHGTTVGLAFVDPSADDNLHKARILAASAGILEDVVDLKRFVTDATLRMDDPHRDRSGQDARPPTGDDWNRLYQKVLATLSAIEERLQA